MSVDWLSQAVTDVKGQAESGKRRVGTGIDLVKYDRIRHFS